MARVVELPPEHGVRADGTYAGGWWHSVEGEDRIVCDLCPRECSLKPGDRGFCFVRQNIDGEMMLTTYGRSTGFCIDPIEKKPLNHFYPGTSVLSFGTAGCNLGCKFCQNWDISKSRQVERLSELAGPEAIAEAARHFGCHSVAYTYNDPIIWAEYAIDTARACRERGIKNVAVTAAYLSPSARAPFYEYMDAANIDLKAFTEEFYHRITYSHLQPVLDTIRWLKEETDVWFEITNLIIPDANDSLDEIRRMCGWILSHVGDEVPIHFTAFHPDFRMQDRPNTPPETLIEARRVALEEGIRFAYVGNVNDVAHQSTYCPECQGLLIQRNWYELGEYHLSGSTCGHCGASIAGRFEARPGSWGRKRQPVQISHFARPLPIVTPSEPPVPVNHDSKASEEEDMSSTEQAEGAAARLRAQRPKLTDEQQGLIHEAACQLVSAAITGRALQVEDPTLAGCSDRTVLGSFVTLKRQGRLRACCGALGRPMPLAQALQQAAVRTATEDARLPTISPSELQFLDLDVSLLYGFAALTNKGEERVDEVKVGEHGLQIVRGNATGLLLPSVATEQGYDAKQFLQQVCRKAGLPSTAWQDDESSIRTFESFSVAGSFSEKALEGVGPVAPVLSKDEMRVLANQSGINLNALVRGATPSVYIPGCSDGNVNGISLTLRPQEDPASGVHFSRLSFRPTMPLQSSLFSLVETAARALTSGQLRLPGNIEVIVSVLHDPAMHGTVAEPDLRGLDPATRAVLIIERDKSAWTLDPEKSAEDLLTATAEQVNVFNKEAASVFSMAAQSTSQSISVSTVGAAVPAGPTNRPAAVAGQFYPSEPEELQKIVEECLEKTKGRKKACKAVMVPHAGLVYSGKVAGKVFSSIKIPDTVIVISPKHTRAGVEWAVAPHETWSIPGAEIKSDTELAKKLVDAIPQLQFDAAAHQGEHGIEVELPLLAHLNPKVKVVGIAIGAGSYAQCQEFAEGLGKVLDAEKNEPLLVISSDMNHYAADEENRRLDEIAMQALERLDPEDVYNTVTGQGISMCGVLPAVMVMETVKNRKGLKKAERLAYATSADAGADPSRVVGYCGLLFN